MVNMRDVTFAASALPLAAYQVKGNSPSHVGAFICLSYPSPALSSPTTITLFNLRSGFVCTDFEDDETGGSADGK
jgi:hypothetical protein